MTTKQRVIAVAILILVFIGTGLRHYYPDLFPEWARKGAPAAKQTVDANPPEQVPQGGAIKPPLADTKTTGLEGLDRYPVKSGDMLQRVFPKAWLDVCELNIQADVIERCDLIKVGHVLYLPPGVTPKVRNGLTCKPSERCWDFVGGSPMCSAPDQRAAMTKVLKHRGISDGEIEEYFEKEKKGEVAYTKELKRGDRLPGMSFWDKRKKDVEIWDNVVVNFEGKELADVYVLTSSGTREVHVFKVKACCNGDVLKTIPITPMLTTEIVIPVQPTPPTEIILKIPSPQVKPVIPPAVLAACYEWNYRAGATAEIGWGAGNSSKAVSIEGELGFPCPLGWKSADGTWNEIVFAVRGHGTSDQFNDWKGRNSTQLIGIGLRQAHPDGSGTLWRLMAGERTSKGTAGQYAHDASWPVVGAFITHYRIDPSGDNETHFRFGFTKPWGSPSGSATYAGSSLSMPEFNYGLDLGVRYFLDNQREEYRKFVEANFNIIHPDYKGLGFRLGICNEFEVVCGVVGVNIGIDPKGIGPMVGIQVNTPGVVRVQRDRVIMDRVAGAYASQGVEIDLSPVAVQPKVESTAIDLPVTSQPQVESTGIDLTPSQ